MSRHDPRRAATSRASGATRQAPRKWHGREAGGHGGAYRGVHGGERGSPPHSNCRGRGRAQRRRQPGRVVEPKTRAPQRETAPIQSTVLSLCGAELRRALTQGARPHSQCHLLVRCRVRLERRRRPAGQTTQFRITGQELRASAETAPDRRRAGAKCSTLLEEFGGLVEARWEGGGRRECPTAMGESQVEHGGEGRISSEPWRPAVMGCEGRHR